MNFEELQKSWKSQPVGEPLNIAQLKRDVKTRFEKHQRKLLLTNIGISLSFVCVFITFGWVYISYHEGHTIFFGASIAAMSILMLVLLWVMWSGIAYKKDALDIASIKYLDYQIEKLQWQRTVIVKYKPAYMVILWVCLMCYMWDVTMGASLWYRVGGPLITTTYILIIWVWTKRTKQKKMLKHIDELVTDLEALKASFANKEITE